MNVHIVAFHVLFWSGSLGTTQSVQLVFTFKGKHHDFAIMVWFQLQDIGFPESSLVFAMENVIGKDVFQGVDTVCIKVFLLTRVLWGIASRPTNLSVFPSRLQIIKCIMWYKVVEIRQQQKKLGLIWLRQPIHFPRNMELHTWVSSRV
jgi:hypothetical protein